MFFRKKRRCVAKSHLRTSLALQLSTESINPNIHLDSEDHGSPNTPLYQSPSSSAPYQYNEVLVFMFLWEDDDLHVLNEVRELEHVFLTLFNFTTHISTIPSRRPYRHVKNEFSKIEHILSRKDCLVIVYYSGHGHLLKYGKMTWSAYKSVSLPLLSLQLKYKC